MLNATRLYVTERFPILSLSVYMLTLILSLSFFMGKASVASLSLAYFAFLSFMFHLRVLDEVKDFAYDSLHHSERPIQKGIVKLNTLITLMVIFLTVNLALSFLFLSFSVSIILSICYIYSYFMFREFYMPNLSNTHTLLYLSFHELVFIPFFIFLFSAINGSFWLPLSLTDMALLLYIFTTIPLIEIGRKIKLRVNSSGVPTNDTYSFKWGTSKTIQFFALLIVTSAILSLFIDSFSIFARSLLFIFGIGIFISAKFYSGYIAQKSTLLMTIAVLIIPLFLFI